MNQTVTPDLPSCVADLISRKQAGATVTCDFSFDVLPVWFSHRANPFQAYIFLCRYRGEVDGQLYTFRKCYARGCPHNLCPHVSQATMIANRYLQRDFARLEAAGIAIERRLFALPDMLVKYKEAHDVYGSIMDINDYMHMAQEGNKVTIEVAIEEVPAVEHFDAEPNRQVFMMADFAVTCCDHVSHIERCLSCYPEDRRAEERPAKLDLANQRLATLYDEFERASIVFERVFF